MDNKLMDTLKVLYNAFDKLNERYFINYYPENQRKCDGTFLSWQSLER